MNDIIIQLQLDALDSNQDITTLLRKALLVAKKLNLSEFESWISSELNGYGPDNNVPIYRYVRGVVKFHNPYRGWLPVMIEDVKIEKFLSIKPLRESIPKMEDLAQTNQRLRIPIPTEMVILLTQNSNAPEIFEYATFLDSSSLRDIASIVKTKILEWAILLEQNGITGNGIVFSTVEKEVAQIPAIANYTNNFYGSVDGIQMQQGTDDSQQT